jgi:hypothetical protein
MINAIEVAKRLHLRFCIIWGDKHTSRFTNEKFIQMWIEDWSDGIASFELNVLKEAIDHCKLNLDWPPSLAEFIKICERSLNVPDAEECMRLAIRGDFNNPLVKTIYDKIGSWAVRSEKEIELIKKFKHHHDEEMINIRKLRYKKYKSLENDNVNLLKKENLDKSSKDVNLMLT